jgi:hypothetical protein
MCYGDIDYGRDGYYRMVMEADARAHAEEQADEPTPEEER